VKTRELEQKMKNDAEAAEPERRKKRAADIKQYKEVRKE